MGHADPMRFHGMTLSIIIISNITIVIVADFLLAASLTVRHGLSGHRRLRAPAPPPAEAAAGAAAARRGEKRTGAKVEVAVPQGTAGRREEIKGRREDSVPPGRGAESAERGVAAAPTRDTGEGGGGSQTTSGGRGEVGRVHCGLHGGERGPTRKRGLFSLEIRGLC